MLEECREADPLIRQSFANKAWLVLLASLRQQSTIEEYRKLYDVYKTELLEKYGISGCEAGYIYNKERECVLRRMLESSCEQFLLDDMRWFERESRLTEWRVKASPSFRTGNAIVAPVGRLVRKLRSSR